MASSNHPISLSPSHPNSGEHSSQQRDRSVSAARSIDIVPLPAEISISSKSPPNSGDNNGDKADGEDDDNSFVAPEDEEVPFHERPWYKRPSAWWILPVFGFVTCFMFMTVAAKTEIYIRLVCEAYKPEIASPLVIDNNSSSSTTTTGPVFIGRSTFVPFGDWGINSQYYDVKVPRPTSQCRADPEVGRRVAALATMVTLTLGLFSVLTTGFWSKLSDSKGRTWVLKICVLGAVLSDINFIAVTLYSRRIPGSYNRFLWSSIVDGLAGGAVTSSAAAHAYISDCVHPTARSRMFSLYLGILYVGMAVSPALGGIAISRTGDLLTPFYAATAGHVAYFLTMFFLVPESLSKRQMVITAERRKAEAEASKEQMMMTTTRTTRNPDEHKDCSSSRARVMRVVKSTLFGFLEPLVMFAPQAVDRDREREREEVGSGRKKDWNLTLIAGASAFVSSLVGASQFKFQYAAALFDWTSEEIGYWVTAVGVTRSVHLVVVLPLIIKIFGPRRADLHDQDIAPNDDRNDSDAHHSPSDATTSSRGTERTPLIHPSRPGVSSRFSHAHHHHHHHHNVAFDLRIAKGSLLVDMIAYFLTSLALESRTFSVATLLSSFGAGYAPAAQSLALSLMSGGGGGGSGDAGKLFGAFAVINSLSSQIAGPAVYGATYILTVSWFPQGILWLSFLISFVAFLSFSFIRHPLAPPHGTYNRSVP